MWDELMGHIGEPTEPEPTVESQAIKAGRINGDGSYKPDEYQHSLINSYSPPRAIQQWINDEIESHILQDNARAVLYEVGFVIIEEGGTDMFTAMGGTLQMDDPIQAIYRIL
jgi:hypothetical protein